MVVDQRKTKQQLIEEISQLQAALANQTQDAELALVMVNATPKRVAYVDPERRIQFVNSVFEEWFGCPRNEVSGKTLMEFFGEAEYTNMKENVEAALAGQRQSFEFRDSGGRYFETTYEPDFGPDGEVRGFTSVVQDITERRETERQLQRYEHIVSSSADMLALLDRNYVYRAVNQAYATAFGRSIEQLLGRTASEVTGDEFFNTIGKPNFDRCLRGEQVSYQRWIEPNVAFGRRFMDTSYYPHRSEGGKIVGVVVCSRDITEYKKAEDERQAIQERLVAAQRAAHIGNWDWNMVTGDVYWSDETYRILGHDPERLEPSFDAFMDAVEPADRESVLEAIRDARDQKRAIDIDIGIIRPDGTKRVVISRAEATFDTEGKAVRMLGAVQDITDRQEAEVELRESREQLRNLSASSQIAIEEERTQIAREIHDELGQGLTALKMDLSWLDKRLGTDQTALSEKIGAMTDVVDESIRTVQTVAARLRPGVLDDLGITAAIEWQVSEFEQRTGVKCRTTLTYDDPALDRGIATTVFRVLQEALTNVTRHSGATGVSVILKRRGNGLVLAVRDNGHGITEQQIVSPESVGLIGMRERARSVGGRVRIVAGNKGKGSQVELSIPLTGMADSSDKDTSSR